VFKRLLSLRLKKSLPGGVGVLVSGTAGAQALLVMAAPLLTRLYSPEDFGLLAVFSAILSLGGVISAGRYELAIPLPENDVDAANLTVLSFLIVVLTSTLLLGVFASWPVEIAITLNVPELAPYLWLLPCGVLCFGSHEVFAKWAIREKRFPTLARIRIYQTLGVLAVQLGAYKLGAGALLGGHAVGQGLGATGLAVSAFKRPELRHCSLAEIRQQASRYRRFPLYSTWTALLNTGSLQVAPIAFVVIYGAAVAGLYAFTLRIISIPGTMVGNAIGNVFLASAAAAHRGGDLTDLVAKIHNRLAMIGALPLMLLILCGPDLFEFLFGPKWRPAGTYAQWMSPWIYFHFQWVPLSGVAIVLEQQPALLLTEAITLVLRFTSIGFCALFALEPDTAICLFSVVSAVVYCVRLTWFLSIAGLRLNRIILVNIKYVSAAALLVFSLLFFLERFLI